MKKLLVATALTALAAANAHAGLKGTNGIYIDTVNRELGGNPADIRADGFQKSELFVQIYGTTTSVAAYIYATDVFGKTATCYTNNPQLIQILQFVQSDSTIWAQWNAGGQCTYIRVTSDSANAPKVP